MRKIPLALSGLILGQLGLGNLLVTVHPAFQIVFGWIAFLLFILLTFSLLQDKKCWQELKNPVAASSFATFPMSLLLLSGYVQRLSYLSVLAPFLWWLGFLLDVLLIVFFTIRFVFSEQKIQLTPSWTVLYVGIATASLTVAVSQAYVLAQLIILYGLAVSVLLFPLLIRQIRKEGLPAEIAAQFAIFSAPLSLLLVSSVQVWGTAVSRIYIWILLILAQSFYAFVIWKIPSIVRQGFHPSFSALTFPTVISALSLKLTVKTLSVTFFPLQILVIFEEIIAFLLVIYVSYHYFLILTKKENPLAKAKEF